MIKRFTLEPHKNNNNTNIFYCQLSPSSQSTTSSRQSWTTLAYFFSLIHRVTSSTRPTWPLRFAVLRGFWVPSHHRIYLIQSPAGSKSQRRDINSTWDPKPPFSSFWPTEGAVRMHFPTTGRSRSQRSLLHLLPPPPAPPPPRRLIFRSLCLVRKGEGDRAEDGVFLNALISVTVWAASSLMWNRHFGSVAHAVKKGCDVLMEKQHPPGDLQITGIHLSLRSFVLSRGSPTSPSISNQSAAFIKLFPGGR